MSDSWNAYRAYCDDVTENNVEPAKLDRLPEGSVRLDVSPHYFEAPAHVYQAPDGRIIEKASTWGMGGRFLYVVFANKDDWSSYRRPLAMGLYLYA